MTKQEVKEKIKEILSKDKRFASLTVKINYKAKVKSRTSKGRV